MIFIKIINLINLINAINAVSLIILINPINTINLIKSNNLASTLLIPINLKNNQTNLSEDQQRNLSKLSDQSAELNQHNQLVASKST